MLKLMKLLKRYESDIEVMANYIFGLPGDTHESMKETFDLIKIM